MRGLSLVAASGGHSSSRCAGLSLSRPLLLRSTGSRCAGSVVVAHGPSCSMACGIFADQGSNPCPLHWQADSQPLRHQGSPTTIFYFVFKDLKSQMHREITWITLVHTAVQLQSWDPNSSILISEWILITIIHVAHEWGRGVFPGGEAISAQTAFFSVLYKEGSWNSCLEGGGWIELDLFWKEVSMAIIPIIVLCFTFLRK